MHFDRDNILDLLALIWPASLYNVHVVGFNFQGRVLEIGNYDELIARGNELFELVCNVETQDEYDAAEIDAMGDTDIIKVLEFRQKHQQYPDEL